MAAVMAAVGLMGDAPCAPAHQPLMASSTMDDHLPDHLGMPTSELQKWSEWDDPSYSRSLASSHESQAQRGAMHQQHRPIAATWSTRAMTRLLRCPCRPQVHRVARKLWRHRLFVHSGTSPVASPWPVASALSASGSASAACSAMASAITCLLCSPCRAAIEAASSARF